MFLYRTFLRESRPETYLQARLIKEPLFLNTPNPVSLATGFIFPLFLWPFRIIHFNIKKKYKIIYFFSEILGW